MNKPKKTLTVVKTEKLNQRKLTRIANRYNISPASVRELQLGFTEEIPEQAAIKLIKKGFVTKSKDELRDQQSRVDSTVRKPIEPVTENEPRHNLVDVDKLTTKNEESITNTDDGDDTFCITDDPIVTSDPKEDDKEL